MANEVTDRITVGVPWSEEAGSGGGIQEVNGYTGPSVQLDAADVGAVPANQFASVAQRGIVQLATNAQALAGANSQNAVTPAALRAALVDRHERSATTIGGLGAGRYPGETALLTISDMRLLVFWNGLAWRPAATRLAGTAAQRSALVSQGLITQGFAWRDVDSGAETVWSGSSWVAPFLHPPMWALVGNNDPALTTSIVRFNWQPFPGGDPDGLYIPEQFGVAIPVSGLYHVSFSGTASGIAPSQMGLSINNSLSNISLSILAGSGSGVSGAGTSITMSGIIPLSQGDIVSVVRQSTGSVTGVWRESRTFSGRFIQ